LSSQPVINIEDAPPITVPPTKKVAEASPAAPTTDVAAQVTALEQAPGLDM